MRNKYNGYAILIALFLLISCNRTIDLNNDFQIGYNEVVNAYHLYYKSEGIINVNIDSYYDNDDYILTKSETSPAVYYINKSEFANAYGSGNWGEGMKTFHNETDAKKFLKLTTEIDWNEIN